ncbi:MAG: hypothetical protein AAB288_00850, partial [Acidobacteriota bacterium]
GIIACKTRRATIEVSEGPYGVKQSTPTPAALNPIEPTQSINSTPTAFLRIMDLTLPPDPVAFERIAITLSSTGLATEEIYDYTLGDTLDLISDKVYTLIVQAYSGETVDYSNEYCTTSHTFTAKLGTNNYVVPLCAVTAQAIPPVDTSAAMIPAPAPQEAPAEEVPIPAKP